jgi:hypothetical protein
MGGRKKETAPEMFKDVKSSISPAWHCWVCESSSKHLVNEHAAKPASFRCSVCNFPYSIGKDLSRQPHGLVPSPALSDKWTHAWRRAWLTLHNADQVAALIARSGSAAELDANVTAAIREKSRSLYVTRTKEVQP